MIKQKLEQLILTAIKQLNITDELPAVIQVDTAKDKSHGDYASNIALIMAKAASMKPREVAEQIVKAIGQSPYIEKIEIAGPGFINFYLSKLALNEVVSKILNEKEQYGLSTIGRGKRVIVEFVSSNPTGPLHVGHGRHAAFGDVVCRLLDAVGFKSYREYYVNDGGRQMDILAVSVWLRYLALCNEAITLPNAAYQGSYVIEIAQIIKNQFQLQYHFPVVDVFKSLPLDESAGGDKEIHIDALIARAKTLLGNGYQTIFDIGLRSIMADISEDLAEFGVKFDNWFSERDFVATDVVDRLLALWGEKNYLYEKDGAVWFRSTQFGDEKDRVLIRSNGQKTYFTNDCAYHLNKFERDFDIAIDLFGSDHHGYVPRIKAAMQASNINPERLLYLIMQFVTLYRGGVQVQMSTRGGNFVTLRELRAEVGNDAARFFYVMRKNEQHMDFDLDLAKSKSNENPVYYVQYAYARICSVFKQAADRQISYDEQNGLAQVDLLATDQERQLLNVLANYPEVVTHAALHYEPHQLTHYLRELAMEFHSYYNTTPFLVDESALRDARLALISAVSQTLKNGFHLLGITAVESM